MGYTESEASNATIPVNFGVIERIHWLKTVLVEVKAGTAVRRYSAVKATGPDDIVFASVVKGLPMRDNNSLPVYQTRGTKAWDGLGQLAGTKAISRHLAELAGADVKDAQAQMRHSRVTTTLEIYQQFVPESQRRVVNKLSELTGSGVVN